MVGAMSNLAKIMTEEKVERLVARRPSFESCDDFCDFRSRLVNCCDLQQLVDI